MSGDCHLLSMFYSGQSISCHFYYFFIINGLAELTGINTNIFVVRSSAMVVLLSFDLKVTFWKPNVDEKRPRDVMDNYFNVSGQS